MNNISHPVFLVVLAGLAVNAFSQDRVTTDMEQAKGIFLTRVGPKASIQAAQFYAVLPSNGQRVSTDHPFYAGDRLTFQFVLKQAAYVYVLNATIPEEIPVATRRDQGKGIIVVPQDSACLVVAAGSWQLLLPSSLGKATKIPAGESTDGAVFEMNDQPGMEVLTVVVSLG